MYPQSKEYNDVFSLSERWEAVQSAAAFFGWEAGLPEFSQDGQDLVLHGPSRPQSGQSGTGSSRASSDPGPSWMGQWASTPHPTRTWRDLRQGSQTCSSTEDEASFATGRVNDGRQVV